MNLKVGDRVKSYDFVLGDMLLTDKAYVVGDIIDIAPVDWCSDNCDHYHIKIFERFDAYGESIEVIGDMVYPPVNESMVVLSNWPNDELEAESFHLYDYVTGKNRSCAWCGGTPKFMVYDLPTGPHAFCSEKHFTRFAGMDEQPPGWYGYDAETGSESHDCGVCGTAVTILNDDYGTCPKCNTFWNLVRLQDLWDGADDDIKVLDAEQTVMLESVKPGTTTESHLWIVRFTTSDDRIIEIPIDPAGGLNREEVIAKAAKVLDRKLSQECDACQVSAWDEVLIEDRRPAYLDEEGDGCSIGKVISCQPCMQLNDEDWIASAFQPRLKEAESVQKFYMVHRHDAKRAGLHYDLRLEDNGALKSWAIPKGMPKSGKHLAIQTPDHALSYGKWEGTIKSGYGAGDVKIDTSGIYKTLSKDSKKWKFEILSGKYKGVWTLTKWKDDKWLIIRNKTLGSENWGGDPEGPLAKALAKARQESKKSKKPLKIEKLSAESSNQMFKREAILFGIGVVSAVVGTFLAEMLIDRYREDPELLDTPVPE